MRLYLDDDSANPLLAGLLAQGGHDVQQPLGAGLVGADDPIHFTHAVAVDRLILTGNYDDFLNLHTLILQAKGHHPGLLVVRRDNDARRDLTPRGIVVAVGKLEAASVPVRDGLFIVNHWR